MDTEENTIASNQQERTDGTEGQDDAVKPFGKIAIEKHNIDGSAQNTKAENGNSVGADETLDQLAQMVMELGFQNEYLISQVGNFKSNLEGSKGVLNQDREIDENSKLVNSLYEQMICLNKEIQEQKEARKAAEAALEHLGVALAEADGKVQDLSMKLVEAQQKMEREIKERDDKYVELDTKFGRLHKRAKQRIQELQKERDDLEAQFNDVNTKVEQVSSQQVATQQELELAHQQAKESLQLTNTERQQLWAANNKLRDSLDEMRHSLEAKDNAIEKLQQSDFEKEQKLEQVQGSLQSVEEKREASIVELSAKHQKHIGSLELQLAEALADRSKATETISSLQMLLAEKDSEIAEIEVATSGEAVRLRAALEEMKGEIIQLKDWHEKERQSWEASCQALRTKLEVSESAIHRSEMESAKVKSQFEAEVSSQNQLLHTRNAELMVAKDEISRLESEFSAYKVRANALLQKKDAELSAAMNSEVVKAHEEAVKEAEKEVAAALAEREKAIDDLQDALSRHDDEIEARDVALANADQQLKSMSKKLETLTSKYLSEKESWQKDLENIEESWKLKYCSLEAQSIGQTEDNTHQDLIELKTAYEKLKDEHESFCDIADRMIEEKEREVARLMDDNKNLHRSLESRKLVDHSDKQISASQKQAAQTLSIAAAEQQILLLARQQAHREEELAQSQRHILALHEAIEEVERENHLHTQQETMLKAELRNMERSKKREGIDMTYLKNVILKLLETGEVEALLPVVATLLQFSPEEIKRCRPGYRPGNEISSPASLLSDPRSTPHSFFSTFSF